jgi:hypothetical protein
MSDKKQTAVEWLIEKISYSTSDGTIISHHFIINKLIEQAKEIEKKQIIEAHGDKLKKSKDAGNYEYWFTGKDYYNKTFKNTENETI